MTQIGAGVITTPMCAKTVIFCGLRKQRYFQILHRIAGMEAFAKDKPKDALDAFCAAFTL